MLSKTDSAQPEVVTFGDFCFDLSSETLWQDASPVPLGSRAARLLATLLRHRPAIVGKADLLDAAWPQLAVEEGNLTVQISALRRRLGQGLWIATVPVRGYRFAGDVSGVPALPRVDRVPPAAGTHSAGGDARPTVAVLPFANLSLHPGWAHLCEGITQDIITELVRRADLLSVVARRSAFAFSNRMTDSRKLGRALNAGYLVEGSLQADGRRVRVSAQLVDARSDLHVWAGHKTCRRADLFTIGSKITDRIADAMARQRPAVTVKDVLPALDPFDNKVRSDQVTVRGASGWFVSRSAQSMEQKQKTLPQISPVCGEQIKPDT